MGRTTRLIHRYATRSLGTLLILFTVLMWTASNFLASTIFADSTYSKPYFVTYLNTSCFSFFIVLRQLKSCFAAKRKVTQEPDEEVNEQEALLSQAQAHEGRQSVDRPSTAAPTHLPAGPSNRLSSSETISLSLKFFLLWFSANFFQSKSLEYTSVGSATILTSTTGLWTLLIGFLANVETFNSRKVSGVFLSFIGIALVSTIDLSGETDKNRGRFPHKSPAEIAAGDFLALTSAVIYAIYTVSLKKWVGDERRVDMLLFLGVVGILCALLLWPGFFIFQWIGFENFDLPGSSYVWKIVLTNAAISVISDMCWAYAVLLTSPITVTVGISLSIPLSLAGQLLINEQSSSILYWAGAVMVLAAFIVINFEPPEAQSDEGNSQTT